MVPARSRKLTWRPSRNGQDGQSTSQVKGFAGKQSKRATQPWRVACLTGEGGDDRDFHLVEHVQVVRRPVHDRADDAEDERSGGDRERRLRCEVDGHFQPVAAGPYADAARRAAVGGQQHHREGEDVGEQQRELAHRALPPLRGGRQLEGDVVVHAVADQPRPLTAAVLPGVELAADEADRLPKLASGPRRGAALDLDRRSRHLDDARVEVDGGAGRQVVGRALAVHQLAADEGGRVAEDVLRPAVLVIDPQLELSLHAGSRERQRDLRRLGEPLARALRGHGGSDSAT
jgi:hypothetical protein